MVNFPFPECGEQAGTDGHGSNAAADAAGTPSSAPAQQVQADWQAHVTGVHPPGLAARLQQRLSREAMQAGNGAAGTGGGEGDEDGDEGGSDSSSIGDESGGMGCGEDVELTRMEPAY